MTLTTESAILGSVLFIFTLASVGLNSSVYIFAFANILGNLLMVLLYLLYLVPSSIAQSFLFGEDKDYLPVKLMGYLFHALWLQDMLIQVITSINRTTAVLFPSKLYLFSRCRNLVYLVVLYVAGFTLSYTANFAISCCSLYLYFGSYSYGYLHGGVNYSNYFLALPVNVSCALIPVICYVSILVFVRKTNNQVTQIVSKAVSTDRRSQEIRYAFQFSICTAAFICVWVLYRALSAMLRKEDTVVFAFLTILHVFHCSANSIVFLVFNTDVRKGFKHVIIRWKQSAIIVVITSDKVRSGS